jgi:hypothetical protein
MNIRALSKILGYNSIKVTLDSSGKIIDELMLLNVMELEDILTAKKYLSTNPDSPIDTSAQEDLIKKEREIRRN